MTSSILWVRFSDESIPIEAINESSLQQLETLWREALLQIGFPVSSDYRFFSCIDRAPYLNFSLLTSVLSNGCISVTKNGGAGFQIQSAKSWLLSSISLMKIHWKLERQLSVAVEKIESLEIRSLALGICQQLLLMRLPRHAPEMLAAWLIAPEKAPASAKRTLRQLLGLQKKRNELSGAWRDFFKVGISTQTSVPAIAPEFVWSDQAPSKRNDESISRSSTSKVWKGIAVSPGVVEGHFWLVPEIMEGDTKIPENISIFIFQRARPQAIELYPRASAIIFVEGGMLSHACCVAREQHIPCLTGLGKSFLSAVRASPQPRLRVEVVTDSGVGLVTVL